MRPSPTTFKNLRCTTQLTTTDARGCMTQLTTTDARGCFKTQITSIELRAFHQ
jgi:hypothetical protein